MVLFAEAFKIMGDFKSLQKNRDKDTTMVYTIEHSHRYDKVKGAVIWDEKNVNLSVMHPNAMGHIENVRKKQDSVKRELENKVK